MKWTTALLTGAAITAAACSDGSITKPPPPPPPPPPSLPPPPPPAGQLVIRSERDTTLGADTIMVGGKVWLRVTGVDTAAAVSWSVNDTAVAGVLEKHFARLHINARKVGNAVVSASLDGLSGTFALVMQQAPDTTQPVSAYQAVDLGTLGGQSARAADINNQGQIVGTSLTGAGAEHAFLWDESGMHDLGASGHDGSEAVRINNSGVIAGTVWTRVYGTEDDNAYTCNIATIWRNGVGTAIDSEQCRLVGAPSNHYAGFFAQPFRVVRAMNGSADVAWASSRKFGSSGWLWQNGSWQELPSLPTAINDRGQVVGARQTNESPLRFHAFFSEGGAPARDLGVLAPLVCEDGRDCSVAVAMDINASGQVVGVSTDGSGHYHFVLWDGAQIKDLGSADFASGQRTPRVFINDRGDIAGSVAGRGFYMNGGGASVSLPASGGSLEVAELNQQGDVAGTILAGAEQRAFVWSQARGMVDLGTGGKGFSGAWVVDINSRGDVVGYTAACKLDFFSENICENWYATDPSGLESGDVRAILWRKN